jgi:hypothetical protein
MAWSKPKDSTGTYKTWRLEDDKDNVYRLLPGHPKAPDGMWKVYLRQHWGYRRPQRKDPSKTYPSLFLCVREKNRDKMITKECAECRKIDRIKAKVESIKQDMKSRGKPEAEINALLGPQAKWLNDHNCDGKWNFLAKKPSGEIGILQIPHKAFLALEILRKEMCEKYKLEDITDIERGIYINFKRTGKGVEMTFTATPVREANAEGYERIKPAPLTAAELDEMEKVLPPLSDIGVKLTEDQIESLASGTEDPEEVDRIFKLSQPAEKSPERSPGPSKPAASPAEPARKPDPTPDIPEDEIMSGASDLPEPTKPAAPAAAASSDDEEEAELERKLAAKRAAKAAALNATAKPAAPAPEPKPEPAKAAPAPVAKPTSVADFDSMDEDTFLSQFK